MTAFGREHFQSLRDALVEAFPTPGGLRELTQFALGRNVARITTASGLDAQVFELIEYAQAQGVLDELIKGGYELNPGNPSLRAFLRDLQPGWCFNLLDATLDARCLAPGYKVKGWKILRRLGAGGMGTVYAVSKGFTEYALKILHTVLERDDDGAAFVREVGAATQLTSNLRSEGVVQVLEGGVDPSLRAPWIVMDMLCGESLRARVQRSGRLSPADALTVAAQLFDTLAEAHGHAGGIVHCDIKPENLFIEATRKQPLRLKVLDFGIARLTRDRSTERAGPSYGTPLYAAPELWEGAEVSAATDVWSCGLVVFFMLVGAEFWKSRYEDLLAVETTADHLPSASQRARELGVIVPESFDAWFARCVERDPTRRFASADGALTEFERAVAAWEGCGGPLSAVAIETPKPSEPDDVPEGATVSDAEKAAGVTLAARLRTEEPLALRDVRRVVADVAEALVVLRAIPGVHGTLEPDRIALDMTDDGLVREARVVDIEARAVVGGRTSRGRTATLLLHRASMRYIAPRVLFGGGDMAPDDPWSLAMIAYEMLTGVAFVDGMTAQARAALSWTPPAMSERAREQGVAARLPEGFDGWFTRCVAGEGAERFESVTECAGELDALLARAERGVLPLLLGPPPGEWGELPTTETGGFTEPRELVQLPVTKLPVFEGSPRVPVPPAPLPVWKRWVLGGVAGVLAAVFGVAAAASKSCGVEGPGDAGLVHRVDASYDVRALDAPLRDVRPLPLPTCPSDMALIPAGSFLMGSPNGQGKVDEHPQHRVRLGAYCMDRTEVSVSAYRACTMVGACTAPVAFVDHRGDFNIFCNWGRSGAEDHPVNCVDWTQAKRFCEWTGHTDGARRLPREAEWEYAARGSANRPYPWGDAAPDGTRTNLCGDECLRYAHDRGLTFMGIRNWRDDYGGTAPVTAFPTGATPEGLLNMGGNVWEWVEDMYAADAYSHHDAEGFFARVASDASQVTENHMLRGGGWYGNDASWVRAALRDGSRPTNRNVGLGFRCARGAR